MRRIVFVLVLISAASCTSSAPTGQRPGRPAAEVDASLAAELQRATSASEDDAPVADAKAGKGFCNFDIYVVGRGGDDRRRLTNHPSLDGSTVSWAPDGERMAFGSTRSGNPEIFVMTADGTRQRNITRHPAGDIGASWSPDGKRILFHSDRDGSNDIWVMDSDGSNATQLTRGPADDVIPSWSPDGSRIAYASGVVDDLDIFVMEADGSKPQRMTTDERDEWWPAWSPDGTRVAFVAHRRAVGGGGINVLNVATGAVSTLDVAVDGANTPAWSSADEIAFVDFPGDVWAVRPDGARLRRVTRTGARELQPAWSPDGRSLAFPAERWVDG